MEMINLNNFYSRDAERWHVKRSDNKDLLFLKNNDLFTQYMSPLALPKENWEQGVNGYTYTFVAKLPSDITWYEYIENYYNSQLSDFKSIPLKEKCAKLREIYVDCEKQISDFNKDKKYSKFRELVNNTVGIRHGKGKSNVTDSDCVNAFREYQKFKN